MNTEWKPIWPLVMLGAGVLFIVIGITVGFVR